MNIRSLGFQDIRECVTLWRLILWSLESIITMMFTQHSWTPKVSYYRGTKGIYDGSYIGISINNIEFT
jgi:hypothetical protein